MKTPKDSVFDLFGVEKESYEKSKDILPTLDIGKLAVGSKVVLKFLESEPKKVSVSSKFHKGKKIETPVIKILVDTIFNMGKDGTLIELPMNTQYCLWLSSKSLAMGVLRIHETHGTLQDHKAIISIGMADYKDFGENRCYSVQQAV